MGLKPLEASEHPEENGMKFYDSFRIVIKNKYLWLVAIMAFLRYGVMMGYQGLWGGPYLMDIYSLQRDATGSILMMVGIGTIVGAPVIGILSDRIFKTRKLFMTLGGVGFTVSTIPLAFFTGDMDIITLYLLSFLESLSSTFLIKLMFVF